MSRDKKYQPLHGDIPPKRYNNLSSKMAISLRLRESIRIFHLKWNSRLRLFSRIIWLKIRLKLRRAAKKYRKIVAKALRDRRLLIIVKIGLMKDFILLERRVK
jgi:hypothetical protein